MANPLDDMVEQARYEPFFFGWLLEQYAIAERLSDASLAEALGCSQSDLCGLRLCRAPRPDEPGFREDVHRVAEALGLNEVKLTRLVRRAKVTATFQKQGGFLMAARDLDEGAE